MSVNLFGRAQNQIELRDAIDKYRKILLKDQSAVALLYTPGWCGFGRIDEQGGITDAQGNKIALGNVFEARIFNEVAELRWLNDVDGIGRAVILSESETAIDELLPGKIDSLSALETGPQTYLLWGQGMDGSTKENWSHLSAARIGKLDVPLADLPPHGRVQLSVREYFQEIDENGNVAVVEERLLGLKMENGND